MAEQNRNIVALGVAAGPEPDEELDASIQADIDMGGTENANAMNLDGPGDAGPSRPVIDPIATAVDPRLPTKKDASLREFLGKMDDYAPIVSFTAPWPALTEVINQIE
jgi:transcription initiation factor TFIID subunit 10